MTKTLHIGDDRALARLADRLAGERRIALDTEFLRERTYYAKLCLVQLAAPGVLAAVDPLSCRDLAPLWRLVTGDAEIVMHAAWQDLEIIQREAGRVPGRVFDTQIAASFLGWGTNLGHAKLVERCTGSRVGRSEAYTDWSRRPLEPEQLEYALDDVRYLHECRDALVGELREAGRLGWVEEEIGALLASIEADRDPEERWRRVSRAGSIEGRGLAILQRVAAWREREAMGRDVPRRRVVPDRALVEIARRAPRSISRLGRIRGLHPREVARSGSALVRLVEEASSLAPEQWPAWPTPRRVPDEAGAEALASLLDGYLRLRARDIAISVRLLATRKELISMAVLELDGRLDSDGPNSVRLMRGWRYEVAGRDAVRLLRGQTTLRVHRSGDRLGLSEEG